MSDFTVTQPPRNYYLSAPIICSSSSVVECRMDKKRKNWNNKIYTLGFLVLWGIINSQNAFSQSLSKENAHSWAVRWFKGNTSQLKNFSEPDTIILTGPAGQENLYVVGFESSGFVIFSADPNPILLAYSFDNPLPADPDHPLFTEWLPSYSGQLSASKRSDPPPLKTASTADVPDMDAFVEPLIYAEWGQGVPWNKFCPSDESNHHAPVGCVAVALAQIMHKWEWPVKGYGENSYIPASHREYGTVEAVFDTTYYQWDLMHNTEPTDASALLLFHTGVATNMNYGPDESGANTAVYAANALINHFRYNPGMILREKSLSTYGDWARLLRQDIVNGRPVLYRGTNPVSGIGHAFNIDGFRDEYFFHFNWGWNGDGNGYFRLETMGEGGADFTKGQAAFFGIQPDNLPQHDRPFGVKVLAGDGFNQLFWDELWVNSLSHYNIYRDGELIGSTWETSYRDEGLINRTRYTYHLSADYIGDEPGESLPTPNIDVTPWDAIQLPYNQDFNDSLAGWQIGGSDKDFQWAFADSLGFQANNSKIVGIRSDSAGPGNKVADHLISPLLDIRGIENVAIKFDYLLRQVPLVDYLFLMFRRFDNGLWYPIARLDSTDSWSDWQTYHIYLPEDAKNTLIQLGFFYTDNNGVGQAAAIDNIELFVVTNPAEPEFVLSHEVNCQYETVTITHQSTGPITNWFWDFGEGAQPRYANSEGPHEISYMTGGPKTVHLVLNHLDHMTKENILDISWNTKADFSYEREGLLVSFNNLSEHPQTVLWDFGDGNTSTEMNPVYQFRSKLIFDVELISYSPPCKSDTMRMELDLRNGTGVEETDFAKSVRIFPNPAGDYCDIEWLGNDSRCLSVELISITGSVLKKWDTLMEGHLRIDLSSINPGIYWLRINNYQQQDIKKIIKI